MNEEKFKGLYEEYKKLKAEISPKSPAQKSGMSRQILPANSVQRSDELKKILRDEGKDYFHLLSAADRFDIRRKS